jgi:hypothetical protein
MEGLRLQVFHSDRAIKELQKKIEVMKTKFLKEIDALKKENRVLGERAGEWETTVRGLLNVKERADHLDFRK